MNLLGLLPYLLLSFLASSFMLLLKPRIISFLLGTLLVATAAVIIEVELLGFVSTALMLLLCAPVVEELLKFAATGYKKDLGSAIGVGSGFAIVENAFYFVTLTSLYSVTIALPFILARAVGDPLLHSASTSISVRAWHGKKLAIPAAIGLHFLYNLFAVAMVAYPSLFRFYPLVVLGTAFILGRQQILILVKTKLRSRKAEIAAIVSGANK